MRALIQALQQALRLRRRHTSTPATTAGHGTSPEALTHDGDGRRPLRNQPPAPKTTGKATGVKGHWVLSIRETIGQLPGAYRARGYRRGDLYEWGLTLIKPHKGLTCRIDGIWFLATALKTLEAKTTIEALSHQQALSNDDLITLIEDHRLPGSPLHLTRTMDHVRRYDSFLFARAPEFMRALHWGGLG